jgi:hypothetical protein
VSISHRPSMPTEKRVDLSMSLTSAGLPTIPARPPATPAQAIVPTVDSFFLVVLCFTCCARRLYKPNLAVEYVDCRRIEADNPLDNEKTPTTTYQNLERLCPIRHPVIE